ncbi:SDR family oxidoreductase [Leptobacterium flavescens]|uniref:SDR family oxidoreductase n=1 Tax=Leptobacterium flavescens TaxID=472055 RepID=A0A6P0UPT3_9FLAO|nr:SDR family oxidoreductase [Leptobacterium flavescens]NER12386.1 SDR family oxidoreductase [Leptobacterium flavescens]
MWNLKNKTALVTGGTKGIGKATVLEFLSLGANVIFTARNENDIQSFEEELQNSGFQAMGVKGDVSSSEDQDRLVKAVTEKYPALDIVVHNAGINIRKDATDYSEDEYRKILNINLIAPFELNRKLYPLLLKGKNVSIINVASVAASQDVRSGSPYAMAKAGLLQQTRSLAVEWAKHNIRVNAISPWYTRTPLAAPVFEQKERIEHIINRTPLQRVAEAEEMANIIAFLAMDRSSYITGQNIVADGGISISAL